MVWEVLRLNVSFWGGLEECLSGMARIDSLTVRYLK